MVVAVAVVVVVLVVVVVVVAAEYHEGPGASHVASRATIQMQKQAILDACGVVQSRTQFVSVGGSGLSCVVWMDPLLALLKESFRPNLRAGVAKIILLLVIGTSSNMGVSENRGTLFWCPYNKDPTI